MNLGFLGLGKLGLPVALAIDSKGHNVCGYDIDERIKTYLDEGAIPYREEGSQELLDNQQNYIDNCNWKKRVELILPYIEE